MKKILLALSMVALTLNIFAQCTPNPIYTGNGNWPKQLDTAWVDSSYNMVITNVVPLDTVVMVTGVPINVIVDSVKIINFTGLPAGYNYVCNPNNCVFMGGTTGCSKVSGTTNNNALVGVHPLQIFTKSYAHIMVLGLPVAQTPQLDTVKSYSLVIEMATTTGISDFSSQDDLAVYPNPTEGLFTMHALIQEANKTEVKVYNMFGQLLINKNLIVANNALDHTIDLTGSKTGMYFLEVCTPKETIRQKVLLK